MKKRILAAAIGLAVPTLWADETQTVDGYTWTFATNDVEAVITGVTPQPTGDLAIPSALAEKTVAGIGEGVFADCYGLTSVVIGDGVRDIGTNAFNRCHGLTNVTIGINVANIGDNAFWDCKTLSGRLTIPNSVTNIGAGAFRYCSGLTGVTIGAGVTSIGLQAFDCCGKLASVIIPDGVRDIGGEAFGHCEGLTSFVVSGTVTNIGERVLVQCTSLRAVYFLGDAPAVGGNIYELASERLTTYVPEDSTGWQAPGSSVLPAKWPAGDNPRNIAHGTPVFVTVTFDANGGAIVGGEPSVTRVAGADEIGALPGAVREGHWFQEWWTEREGGERVMEDTLVTEGMTTVYAHWAAGCPFTMGGDAAWTQEPDGSWRSGAIDNYQETWIATNIAGRGTLSFKWKVSSESCDTLSFVVGTATNGVIYGEIDWTDVACVVTNEGSHAFKWVYSKDRSISSGSDCGWVDEVTWTPYVENSYAAWAGENGLGGPEETTDGQPNLIRYAFDKPAGAFSPITNIAFTAAGRPVLSLLPLNAAATGFVTVKVLSTTNLADWAHAEEVRIRVNANGRIAFPTHDGDMRFYRLSATEGASPGGVQLWENGPYWAECNVGASKPEDYGYYFWWGDTVGYVRSGGTRAPFGNYYSSVTWVSSMGERTSGSPFSPSSCPTYGKADSELLSAGCVDSTGNLAPEYDAAHVHWGDGWRMPTDAEFAALTNNCTAAWITTNGVSGRLVTGKGAYADRSIFLPAAGYGSGANFGNPDSRGYYRSSTPDSDDSYKAWYLDFNSNLFQRDTYYARQYGLSVRPVRDAD